MAVVKVGINGFGRIGRLVFRASLLPAHNNVEVVAINDPFLDINHVRYLLVHDSVHGTLTHDVKVNKESLVVDGKEVHVHHEKDPSQIPWGKHNVDVVVESSGVYLTKDALQGHIKGGAKKVVLSAPPKDDIPVFVVGVNHHLYDPKQLIVSNASCTTNCLAVLAKVVHDNFGIVEGLVTTVHAATSNQLVVDGPSKGGKDWRAGRCALNNVVPASTGAAKAVGKVLPDLLGKLTAVALRVPVGDVSVVDLVCRLNKPAPYNDIITALKKAADGPLKGVLGVTEELVVSQDLVHDHRSCVVDVHAGLALNDHFVKLIAWYDNEWGYTRRVLDLVAHVGSVH